MSARQLPSGLVTFAFIDVVGSTRAFVEHEHAFVEALAEVHQRAEVAAARGGGVVVSTEGDGAFLAFGDAEAAVEALCALQEELAQTPTTPLPLTLRAGAHAGPASPVGDNYVALAVNVAARVTGAANSGQLLVTDAVIDALAGSAWSGNGRAEDVGTFALKDLAEPVRVWRLAGDTTPPRATPARRTNVREPRTSFVGRDADVEALRELVREPGLVTVLGPGGVGKTRLVSELALADAEEFPGGAWLVELASIASADQVVATLASSLGLPTNAPADVEADLVRRGRCLLVLDNCEHLTDAVADLVDRILERCEHLTVLCTSREPLRLADERVLKLSPLPPVAAGVHLFLDRLGGPERDRDLDQVRQLCEALDGLPLAIELAAGHAKSAPLAELIDAVVSGADALARRGGAVRQRSLDAVLAWSLERLPPALLDSLLVLSVFPGRFTTDMARRLLEAVPSCDPSAARALAARSLVDLDGEEYRLLATIRAAARRRCAADPHLQQQAYDALVSWTAAYGEERYDILTYHDDVPPDTVLALEAGLARGVDADARGLGKAWYLMAVLGGARGAGTGLMEAAGRVLEREEAQQLDHDAVLTMASAGILRAFAGGVPGLSETQGDELLEAARATGDPRLLERVHAAVAASKQQRGEDSLDHRLETLRLAEQHPEVRHQLPSALNNVGAAFSQRKDGARARSYYVRAVAAAEEAGFVVSEAIARGNIATDALNEGQYDEAVDQALRALRTAPPEWRMRGWVLCILALALAGSGDRGAAVAAAREALPAMRAMPMNASTQGAIDELLEAVPEAAR